MKTKHLLFLTLILLCFNLTSCTVDANRIYTICKRDNNKVYCYSNDGVFFEVLDDGSLIQTSGVGLNAYPELHLIPKEYGYTFVNVLPGLYSGTLKDVSGYVNKLLIEGYTYEIVYSDCYNIELYAYSESCNIRILFNKQGEVRIYSVDNSDNYINPPYLIEE